jgi:hypothetical protein
MARVTMKRILVDKPWLTGALEQTRASQGKRRERDRNISRPARPAEALIMFKYG